jgi:hypothetical protein
MRAIARVLWLRIPAALSRGSTTLAVIVSDGSYMVRWPLLALLSPLVAVAYGVALSQTRLPNQLTYTYSVLGLVPMVVIGGFSAALGLEAVLGYAVFDFFLFPQHPLSVTLRLALLVSYVVLAVLSVLTPLSARLIRDRTRMDLSGFRLTNATVDAALAGAIAGLLTYLWTEASAVLIRPVFVWTAGGVPTDEAIHPLQQFGWILAVVAAGVGVARSELERTFSVDPGLAASLRRSLTRSGRPVVAAVSEGAFLTLLLGGLIDSWLQLPLVLLSLLCLAYFRRTAPARLPLWPRLLGRIPLLVRLLVGIVAAALIGRAIVTSQFRATQSLWPVTASAVAGMVVIAALLPDLGARTDRRPRPRT